MVAPTVSQRVEDLEDFVVSTEVRVSDMVSQTVENAVSAMKHSLVEMLLQGQTEVLKKHSGEMEVMVIRLEGRINRSREQ